MTYEEKQRYWDTFSDLYEKRLVDTIVQIKFLDSETWTYGSLRHSDLSMDISLYANQFIESHPGVENGGVEIHLVYLPFSEEPIHLKSKLTSQDMSDLSAFGSDLFYLISNSLEKELRMHLTDRFEKLAHSNGLTYRTFDHVFSDSWNETLKNTPIIDYLDTNNQ